MNNVIPAADTHALLCFSTSLLYARSLRWAYHDYCLWYFVAYVPQLHAPLRSLETKKPEGWAFL